MNDTFVYCMNFIGILNICYIIRCYFSVNVTWNMKTKPAIIGNDVILECVISGEDQSCDKYPRQWYGGANYGLLCEDKMCRNNKKYKEVTISSCEHHLVIDNFTEQDLNQNYTCSYGIVNDRKGLALKDGPFECKLHWLLGRRLRFRVFNNTFEPI